MIAHRLLAHGQIFLVFLVYDIMDETMVCTPRKAVRAS